MKNVVFVGLLSMLNFIICAPIEKIPKNLWNEFTLNNTIPVYYSYHNGEDERPENNILIFNKSGIDSSIHHVKNWGQGYYGITDLWLYQALTQNNVRNKHVAVIGSITCWYESILLAYGAKPTTIEYNPIISKDSRIKVYTVEEFWKNPIKFDSLLSISSIEHDGLGKYGDPINPNGDLQTMEKLRSILKDDGLLFLSIPVGKDALYFNAHRIYGKIRLPLLLKRWKIIATYGFSEEDLNISTPSIHQPVFVLQKI